MPRKQLRPSIKLRRKYAALIELCKNKILTSPPQTSGSVLGDKRITIVVKWNVVSGVIDRPKDFPNGTTLDKSVECVVQRHDVKVLLEYFHKKGYVSYTASDLFSQRLPTLMRLAKTELKLDRMLECVDFEQQFEKELADSDDSEYNERIQ